MPRENGSFCVEIRIILVAIIIIIQQQFMEYQLCDIIILRIQTKRLVQSSIHFLDLCFRKRDIGQICKEGQIAVVAKATENPERELMVRERLKF